MKLQGLIHKTSYRLSRHLIFGWPLLRWLVLLLLIAPILSLLKALFQWPVWGWLELESVSLFSVAFFFIVWQSKRHGFMRFRPASPAASLSVPSDKLPHLEKIPLRASGNFRVRGITRYFVEETALYQPFATGERVVMVNIPATRFMLLAHSPNAEIGWWYSFFTPENLITYQSGTLYFGLQSRPALQLIYQPDDAKKPETLYLSFDAPAQRAQVLADLKADEENANNAHSQPPSQQRA
ncbi:MAG TPA: hypothetical protein ENK24_02015 [Anaerolineae bacterium]|nr:hypothetical protein [Anaerolineae bacterium]